MPKILIVMLTLRIYQVILEILTKSFFQLQYYMLVFIIKYIAVREVDMKSMSIKGLLFSVLSLLVASSALVSAVQVTPGTVVFDGLTGKKGYNYIANKAVNFPAFWHHPESEYYLGLKYPMIFLPLKRGKNFMDMPQWLAALNYMRSQSFKQLKDELGQPEPQFALAAQKHPILNKYSEEREYVIAAANYATPLQKKLVHNLKSAGYTVGVATNHDTVSVDRALAVYNSPFKEVDFIIAVCDYALLKKHNISTDRYCTSMSGKVKVVEKKNPSPEYVQAFEKDLGQIFYVSRSKKKIAYMQQQFGDRVTPVYCKDPQDTEALIQKLKVAGVNLP